MVWSNICTTLVPNIQERLPPGSRNADMIDLIPSRAIGVVPGIFVDVFMWKDCRAYHKIMGEAEFYETLTIIISFSMNTVLTKNTLKAVILVR